MSPAHPFAITNLLGEAALVLFVLGTTLLFVLAFRTSRAARLRTRRLDAISTIAAAIAQRQNSSAMLQIALGELRKLMGAAAAWFRIVEAGQLVLAQQVGVSEELLKRVPTEDASRYLARDAGPTVVRATSASDGLKEIFRAEGFDHALIVPIHGKNSVIGVLTLASNAHRSYSREEMRFLETTANQLGLAVENVRMFEAAVRSQRRWISTFDSIEDLVLLHDGSGRIMKVNRALAQRLGKPFSDVLYKLCEEVLPNRGHKWIGCPYCSSLKFSESADPCFGGYSIVTTSSYREDGTDRLGTIHIIRDTTDRRDAQEKYRLLFEQVQEGVFVSTPEGRLLEFNETFQRMLGHSREKLQSADIAQELYADSVQRDRFRQEMAKHGSVRNYEVTLRRADGTLLHGLESSFATRDDQGRIINYQGVLLDITEKKNAEDELRRRNRELNVLNAISVIATESFDLDEILNLSLRHVMDTFGGDAGAVYVFEETSRTLHRRVGQGFRSQALLQATRTVLPEPFWETIRSSRIEVFTHEHESKLPANLLELLQAEGLRSWLSVVLWSRDKVVGVLAISWRSVREVSGRDRELLIAIGRQLATLIEKARLYEETRRAYEDLRKTQEQLLQSEKMSAIGQLISGVAHELNNPLTAILGYAQLLEGENLNERAREFIQKLFRQAQRTHRVVQNLLSFARQRKPVKIQVDIGKVVEDTLALRDYDLKLNNIETEREVQPHLPQVVADPHQLEQVFLNIVNNAADAILESSAKGKLRVRAFAQDGFVCTEFHDSGKGIVDPGRIFDPFYTTKEVGKGTGLGLSICYGIVKEHGGEIIAFNHPGGGAVFQVRLPKGNTEVRGRMDKPKQPISQYLSLQGRFLLVDDEEAVLEFEREVLTAAGAEVVALTRGDEAYRLIQHEQFDALILDGKMPGSWSGIELFQWLQINRPEAAARVLLTLSNTIDPHTQRFVEGSDVAYILKPFETNELLIAAKRLMEKTQAAKA